MATQSHLPQHGKMAGPPPLLGAHSAASLHTGSNMGRHAALPHTGTRQDGMLHCCTGHMQVLLLSGRGWMRGPLSKTPPRVHSGVRTSFPLAKTYCSSRDVLSRSSKSASLPAAICGLTCRQPHISRPERRCASTGHAMHSDAQRCDHVCAQNQGAFGVSRHVQQLV